MNRTIKATRRSGQKTTDLGAHARQRFGLRFGITLTPALSAEIVRTIRSGRSTFVEKQSNAISLHRVQIQERNVVVVYDKVRGVIVTALYPDDELPAAS